MRTCCVLRVVCVCVCPGTRRRDRPTRPTNSTTNSTHPKTKQNKQTQTLCAGPTQPTTSPKKTKTNSSSPKQNQNPKVREAPEPVGDAGNRLLRVLDPGTVLEATERRITATGALRWRLRLLGRVCLGMVGAPWRVACASAGSSPNTFKPTDHPNKMIKNQGRWLTASARRRAAAGCWAPRTRWPRRTTTTRVASPPVRVDWMALVCLLFFVGVPRSIFVIGSIIILLSYTSHITTPHGPPTNTQATATTGGAGRWR